MIELESQTDKTSTMLNMQWPFPLFFLFLLLLCFSVADQESTQVLLTLHNPTSNLNNNPHLAISVSNQELSDVANSVLMAETWLRTHVLPYYPSFKITHIVVGHNILCFSHTHPHQPFHFILPALKNLHHSLTRWGLHTEIKVSPSLSSHCLAPNLSHSLIKPFLHFIQDTNSTYLINPSEHFSSISDIKIQSFLSTHLEFLKKLGFSSIDKINLVVENETQKQVVVKPTMRKLAFVVPHFQIPLPPLVGPSPLSIGLSPALSPHSHQPHLLPPCNPWTGSSPPQPTPSPVAGGEKLWCVAKPSVPAETLQEAMDYACGEGEAECEEIKANGRCYYPDTVVAHASFAFNSYWQKSKRNGGTCNFGDTAMLINSDPSYLHCKFIVS